MNIALLFNSDHPTLGRWYGPPVVERILGTRVLQEAKRFMRVSEGDILTFSAATKGTNPTRAGLVELCRSVYQPKEFDRLVRARLDATFGVATVFCCGRRGGGWWRRPVSGSHCCGKSASNRRPAFRNSSFKLNAEGTAAPSIMVLSFGYKWAFASKLGFEYRLVFAGRR